MTEQENKVKVSEEQKAEVAQAPSEASVEEALAETKDESTVLAEENADLKDKLLRMAAEMENLRKRHQKELTDARNYAAASFAKEMLSVQDNMTRALDSLSQINTEDDHLKGVLEGVKLVSTQLENTFKQAGIEQVKSLGEKLNPELHQAMTQVESEEESGTVINVLQEGYTMHGRLLRPAMVVVSK